MSTIPYNLTNDYLPNDPVSATDLNNRAKVLAAQLPGALRTAALTPGVFPLYEPEPDQTDAQFLAELVAQTQDALKVSLTGAVFTSKPGAAAVLATDGTLTYTQTDGLSKSNITLPATGSGDILYLHLDPLDAIHGQSPDFLASELESEPGHLLLASVDETGTITDRRTFTGTALYAVTLDSFRQRLDALITPPTDGDGALLLFGTTIPIGPTVDTTIKTYIDAQVDALTAAIASAIAQITPGQRATRQPLDLLYHELQITRGELAIAQQTLATLTTMLLTDEQQATIAQNGLTGRPRVIERSQSLTIGPSFGSGENNTPDFDGPGPSKNQNGTFGTPT